MSQGSIHKITLPSGAIRYEARLDVGRDPGTGKRVQECRRFVRRADATAWLSERIAQIAAGYGPRTKRTLADALDDWMEGHVAVACAPSTRQMYDQAARLHVLPYLGAVPIHDLTPDRLQRHFSGLLQRGVGPGMVKRALAVTRAALERCVRVDVLPRNPASRIALTLPRPPERQVWTAAEAERFLVHVGVTGRFGPLWFLALATGMRQKELLDLRWSDVDLSRGVIEVRAAGGGREQGPARRLKTTGSRRRVALPPSVFAVLEAERTRQRERRGDAWCDDGYVLAGTHGQRLMPQEVRAALHDLSDALGLPRITFHDLRHTHGSLMLDAGAHIKAVSERMGHSTPLTTISIYTHSYDRQHQEMAGFVDALFGAAVRDWCDVPTATPSDVTPD